MPTMHPTHPACRYCSPTALCAQTRQYGRQLRVRRRNKLLMAQRHMLPSSFAAGFSPLRHNEWDASPSPIEHSNVVWSCYTIKKRLRVVSAATPSVTASEVPSTSASMDFAIPSASSVGHLSGRALDTASSSNHTSEQQDYFGPPAIRNREELNPLSTMTHNHMSNTVVNASSTSRGSSSQPNHLTLPSIEDLSFTNECVLRAHSAGDVDSFHRDPKTSQDHDMGFFDWTRLSLTSSLPKHIQFARSIDWSSTPLGPIEFWSNDLRAMCNLIM
jgi:hypothetical protein